jgi:hypothetical protein
MHTGTVGLLKMLVYIYTVQTINESKLNYFQFIL